MEGLHIPTTYDNEGLHDLRTPVVVVETNPLEGEPKVYEAYGAPQTNEGGEQ